MSSSPVVLNVAHTGLTVRDLDAALTMWCDDLGFTLERTFTINEAVTTATTGVRSARIRAATVVLGQQCIELLEYDPSPSEPARASPAQSGATHIALTIADLDRALTVCGRHGWVPVGEPYRMTDGPRAGTRIIYLHGPAGGTLELLAPPATTDPAP